jgi:hypothetical protein
MGNLHAAPARPLRRGCFVEWHLTEEDLGCVGSIFSASVCTIGYVIGGGIARFAN